MLQNAKYKMLLEKKYREKEQKKIFEVRKIVKPSVK